MLLRMMRLGSGFLWNNFKQHFKGMCMFGQFLANDDFHTALQAMLHAYRQIMSGPVKASDVQFLMKPFFKHFEKCEDIEQKALRVMLWQYDTLLRGMEIERPKVPRKYFRCTACEHVYSIDESRKVDECGCVDCVAAGRTGELIVCEGCLTAREKSQAIKSGVVGLLKQAFAHSAENTAERAEHARRAQNN